MALVIEEIVNEQQNSWSESYRSEKNINEQKNGWSKNYPSNITLETSDCILEDGYYFLGVAIELAQLVEPETSQRMRYIQTNLLDYQPCGGYVVPFYYADELAMHLEGTIESLNEVSDSAYQVRPEATEHVLAAVPRYVTSWEAGGKQKHTLANVVFPIMRLQDFLERAATVQQDVTIL